MSKIKSYQDLINESHNDLRLSVNVSFYAYGNSKEEAFAEIKEIINYIDEKYDNKISVTGVADTPSGAFGSVKDLTEEYNHYMLGGSDSENLPSEEETEPEQEENF